MAFLLLLNLKSNKLLFNSRLILALLKVIYLNSISFLISLVALSPIFTSFASGIIM